MSDKKKKAELTIKTGAGPKGPSAKTDSMGINGPGATFPQDNPQGSAKTNTGLDRASDEAIASGAEQVAKKGSAIGLDVRALLNSAKKVKDNAKKTK